MTMDRDRWARVRELFDQAVLIGPEEWDDYLREACGDDTELLEEVLSLLRHETGGCDPLGQAVQEAVLGAGDGKTLQLEPGRRLGRYTIVDILGSGGMGQIYTAEDRELRRKVALKVITDWRPAGTEHLRRFRREARVLAALNHPNIVTLYSVEHEDELHFLTMELVEGVSLDDLVSREGPGDSRGLEIGRIFDVAVPLARALAAAHRQGVTHRDLKPANVMLSEGGQVKVLDFGLAKLRNDSKRGGQSLAPSATLTQAGVVLGTVPYMSPEQVEGKELDARTDIFSFGVMLYEMVTGARPFQGDSSAAVMSSILKERPPPMSGLRRQLPPRLVQIVERCLEKDPAGRYPDGEALLADLMALREAVESHPRISRGLSRLSTLIPRARPRRVALAGAAAATLVAVALIAPRLGDRRKIQPPGPQTPTPPKIASLAVLPLANLSGDPSHEYLADGMTEVLITELSKIGALKVISRTSVMRLKGSDQTLPEIAGELGVEAVVEGSVLRVEDRIRVTAQLIHAASDEHLWAESFERDLRDLLTLQGEVARAIAAHVEATLTPEERARLAGGRAVDPRASEAYLRGRHLWNQFRFAEAIEAYREAIELDPDFARAYAGLAHARQLQGVIGFPHPPRFAYAEAKEAASRALELDDESAEVHTVNGWIALNFDRDWEVAGRSFARALELGPSDAQSHSAMAYYLAAMGRTAEAVAAAERAVELDPLSPMINLALCEALYFDRRYGEGLFQLGELFEISFPPTYWMHSRLLEAQGDREGAAWSMLRASRGGLFSEAVSAAMEEALTSRGPEAFWRERIEFYLSWPQDGILAKDVAEMLARVGDTQAALDWLERAYERGDAISHLAVDPIWDPLRGESRFQDILGRLQLPRS